MSFDSRGVFLYTDFMITLARQIQLKLKKCDEYMIQFKIKLLKKDYIAIATILNKYSDAEHMILLKLCEYFKEDNPNFDADKFLDMVADDNIS